MLVKRKKKEQNKNKKESGQNNNKKKYLINQAKVINKIKKGPGLKCIKAKNI